MYGMVNQAIKAMVIKNLGATFWEEICLSENIDPSGFSSFSQYDDSITSNIVGRICEKTKNSPAEVLENFGIFWINYAKKSEYQSILTAFSSNPVELIESLDALHSRLQLSFENLKAPSFWVTHLGSNEILVHYKSQRNMSLEYFVVGLLKGVFQIYDQKCEIEIVTPTKDESAVFKVCF